MAESITTQQIMQLGNSFVGLGQSSIIHNHFTHATIISVTEKEKTIVASVSTFDEHPMNRDDIIFCYYSIPLYFVIICIHCTLSTLLDTVAAALQTNIITWTNNVSMLWRVECIEYLDPCIAHDYVSVWCDSGSG